MSVEKEEVEYVAKTARSRALHEEACGVMPGGNSRTTTFFDPYPFYITRGQGAHLWDADGNARLDFNGNYTSLILGHAPEAVVRAAQEAITQGLSFPGRRSTRCGRGEAQARIQSMESVRFTNSRTEATMNAIAREGVHGRQKTEFEGASTDPRMGMGAYADTRAAAARKNPSRSSGTRGFSGGVKHVSGCVADPDAWPLSKRKATAWPAGS